MELDVIFGATILSSFRLRLAGNHFLQALCQLLALGRDFRFVSLNSGIVRCPLLLQRREAFLGLRSRLFKPRQPSAQPAASETIFNSSIAAAKPSLCGAALAKPVASLSSALI
jgi:hypothetical protein